MKKIIITIFLTVSLLCSAYISYSPIAKAYSYIYTLHSHKNGAYVITKNEDTIFVRNYALNSKETTTTFTLGKRIFAYTTYNEKIYVIYQANEQTRLVGIAEISSGKVKEILSFKTTEVNTKCKLAVDSKENFYILNSQNEILIYNKSGTLLTKTEKYHNMLSINGKCFGIQYDKIQIISPSGVSKTYYINSTITTFTVSDKYIGITPGEIYTFGNEELDKVMDISIDPGKNPCETEDYIVSIKDNNLVAYSKVSGNEVDKYSLDKNVYAISSYNNNIFVLYKDYSVENFSADAIFKEISQKPITSTKKNGSDSLNKFIIVPQGTTAYSFKTNLYKDYTVKFNDGVSGQLGTNTSVKMNGKNHIIIVNGDLTGEGNINSRDISAMFDHLLEIKSLEDGYLYAADLNNDNKITNEDLVLLSKLTK